MAAIDLTLDSFKVPAIDGYTPPFGTMVTRTEANKGGLSTVEVNSNIMMPFANMRPKVVTENSSTTAVEYDAKLCFSASLASGAVLTLGGGDYEGCRVQITNLSAYTCAVNYGGSTIVSVPSGANIEVFWTGSTWMLSTTGTVATGNVMAPTSSAVHAAIDAKCPDYSTTEHLTGRKWKDGKPTYEMVVQVETFTSSNPLSVSIPNLDTLIDVRLKRNYDTSHPTWWTFGDGTASTNNIIVTQSTDTISIKTVSTGETIKNFTGILEYTRKTE